VKGAWRVATWSAVVMLAVGCQMQRPRKVVKASPPPQARRATGLSKVDTVLVLPFENESAYPEAGRDVEQVIAEEIRKATGMRLRSVSKQDERLGVIEDVSRKRFSFEELAYLHREFGTDAVLRGTVVSSRPYPQTALGLRLEMTDLRTGDEVWSMEEMWDAGEQGVAARASST